MTVKKPATIEEFKLMSQSNSWMRIGKLAKNKGLVFNNLFQHFNVENLREAFAAIDGSKVGTSRRESVSGASSALHSRLAPRGGVRNAR